MKGRFFFVLAAAAPHIFAITWLAGMQVAHAGQSIDFKDLQRPGRPAVKSYPVPGLQKESSEWLQGFSDSDGQERVRTTEAMRNSGSAQSNSSTNERWTVLSHKKVHAVSWHGEISARCNSGVNSGETYTVLVLDSGRYQSVYGPTENTLSKVMEFHCK